MKKIGKSSKIVLLILTTMLICSMLVSMASCGKIKIVERDSIVEEPDENMFIKNPIDWEKDKDDVKLLTEKVIQNGKYVPYFELMQAGTVSTVTLGMTVEQTVLTVRLCQKTNVESDDEIAVKRAYLHSYSITTKGIAGVDIRLMTETILNGDPKDRGAVIKRTASDPKKIKYNTENGDFYNTTGKWRNEPKDASEFYYTPDSVEDPPDAIFAYDIRKETIKKAKLKKAVDEKTKQELGYYTLEIEMSPKAWERYIEVMKVMLEASGTAGDIDYKWLRMTVNVWPNGLIRDLRFVENYKLDIAGGALKADATLDGVIQLNYNQSKANERFNAYTKRNCKSFSSNRQKPGNVSDSVLK